MPPVVVAAGIGAAAGIGGAVLSSSAQKKAAKKAAETAKDNTTANNALSREMYASNAARLDPYSANGLRASNALSDMLLGPTSAAKPAAAWQPGTPGGSGVPQYSGAPAGWQPGQTGGSGSVQYNPGFRDDAVSYGNEQPGNPTRYNLDNGLGGLADILRRRAIDGPRPGPGVGGVGGVGGQLGTVPAAVPAVQPLSAANEAVPGGYQPPAAFNQFMQGTNYQWRLHQGLDAVSKGAFAQGWGQSGAADKAKIAYGQNLASSELGRYQDLLAQQQGMGLTAASALAGVGQSMVGQVTANNNSAASAVANAALMRGQANANMYGGIASGIGQIGGALASSYGPSSYSLSGGASF